MALREGVFGNGDPGFAVRLVLSLSFLVLNHTALLVQTCLGDGPNEMSHAVGFEPEDAVERRDRHVLEIVGPVFVGRSIEVRGAQRLHCLEVVVVVVLAAVEHQVLEKVGESGLAHPLIFRTDVIPDIHGRDRRFVIFVHEKRQAISERELPVRDVGNRRIDRWSGRILRNRGKRHHDAASQRACREKQFRNQHHTLGMEELALSCSESGSAVSARQP